MNRFPKSTVGGRKLLSHKEIVAQLKDNCDLSPWWQMMITVGYEFARNKRVVGETSTSGFQIGVQKTLPFPVQKNWTFITSRSGINLWLGKNRAIITKIRTDL